MPTEVSRQALFIEHGPNKVQTNAKPTPIRNQNVRSDILSTTLPASQTKQRVDKKKKKKK